MRFDQYFFLENQWAKLEPVQLSHPDLLQFSLSPFGTEEKLR